jgi:ribosomal protein L7Ae-like RNA K-turn-binding protein
MSRESALSALKAYKHKQGIKEGRKQFSANNKQDFAQLVAISESIKGNKR